MKDKKIFIFIAFLFVCLIVWAICYKSVLYRYFSTYEQSSYRQSSQDIEMSNQKIVIDGIELGSWEVMDITHFSQNILWFSSGSRLEVDSRGQYYYTIPSEEEILEYQRMQQENGNFSQGTYVNDNGTVYYIISSDEYFWDKQ